MRDHDSKYSRSFDKIVQKRGVRIKKTMFQSPNTNAFVERFIQTLGQECLNHFIVFGTEHFDVLTREFAEHYHAERPHQAKDNEVLAKPKPKKRHKQKPPDTISLAELRCEQKLGGLLKSYKWVA